MSQEIIPKPTDVICGMYLRDGGCQVKNVVRSGLAEVRKCAVMEGSFPSFLTSFLLFQRSKQDSHVTSARKDDENEADKYGGDLKEDPTFNPRRQ